MKRNLLLISLLACLNLMATPPQLTWRISNPRIIRVAATQRLEFEVQVKANMAGTYYSSGQFMIYFNNDAISYSSDLHWTAIPAGISAQTHPDIGNKYIIARVRSGLFPNVKVLVGLSPTDEAIIDEDPAAGYLAEITTEWQTYVKLQCRITDANGLAGIYFSGFGTDGQNFYLAAAGSEVGYNNPSLYEPLNLSEAYLGRIYSSAFGWTQYGGATNDVPYLNWATSVNTSVWEGAPTIAGSDYLATSLRIHNGASLTIPAGSSLTVSGTLTNETGSTGLNILSTASSTGSLIHNSDNVPATVQRYISGSDNLTQMKYHLVSMPITTGALSGWWLDSYLYRFDAPTQDWVAMGTSATTPLAGDQGYMVYYPGVEKTYSFSGPIFNGPSSLAVSYYSTGGYEGLNLVPNPFPSAIDWNSVAGWTKTNISNAFWIWNPMVGNYASYGSYGTLNATQYIPQGQAFFVKASASGPTLEVNNSARVHNSQAFFKNSDPPGLLRFIAKANMMKDEMLVAFDQFASPLYDPQEDVVKLFGSDMAPQLFSLSQNDEKLLTVNATNLPGQGCTIPIGLQLEGESLVTLSFLNMKEFDPNYNLLLEDLITGLTYDLRALDSLEFDHLSGNVVNRFLLHVALVTGMNEGLSDACKIWANENKVYFTHPSAAGTQLNVKASDLTGRLLIALNMPNSSVNSFSLTGYKGVIIVSVEDKKGVSIGKIFLNSSL